MSTSGLDDSRVRIILRTADQYHLWRARVNASCWAATRVQVFTITDDECNKFMHKYADEKADTRQDIIGKCWTLITTSLHDELFLKLVHVEHGLIASLMSEIRSALLVNIAEDVQPLRLELYAASMQRDCNNDLQSFVAFIIQRRDKLLFLKIEVPDDELVHIFLKGLPSIFQPLQVHFAIPGNKPTSFANIVEIVRRFSATSIVSAELAKLKSAGLSQNVFASVSRPNVNFSSSHKEKPFCIKFSKTGVCSYGDKCKFYHATSSRSQGAAPSRGLGAPGPPPSQEGRIGSQNLQECAYCHNKGHSIDVCRKRAARNNVSNTISLSVLSEEKMSDNPVAFSLPSDSDDPLAGLPAGDNPFCFVASQVGVTHKLPSVGWVFDSGATCCATNDSADCVDIVKCSVRVTAAGCTFDVHSKGTAVIWASDTNGGPKVIQIRDCLISEKFPFKLLALQSFVKKGHTILMKADTISISNQANDVVLTARLNPHSQLYFLQEEKTPFGEMNSLVCPDDTDIKLLLAKAYQGTTGGDLLWKLHLRHGHKNFTDVCRQYGLPVPKTTPACTSCVMGKSHLHPHLSSGFSRATRIGEGFHSDFRGPFSCPTYAGHIYLLTIIDDYSRRIFAFLVKSQTEWFELWVKFVTRIEAELGRANVIAWLLSDNGGVYKSQMMISFCATKGIQQRYSAPYSQFMDHTAERNMRTIGEMMTTTMIHANLPKKAWGWAALHAADVINRTSESALSNKASGANSNSSRLERWKGTPVPGQTKGLYPLGCLAFKHVPSVLRTKLDAHATPVVYLGIDANSRAFLLGSIYDLALSVSVEVTFFENVFPFRKLKQQESASSLLWGTDPLLHSVDPRLGAFDTSAADTSGVAKLLERDAIKSVATPAASGAPSILPPSEVEVLPSASDATIVGHAPEAPIEPRRSTRVSIPRPQTNQRYRVPLAKPVANLLVQHMDGNENSSGPLDLCVVILNTITEASLETITPRNAFEALKSQERRLWLLAMSREKECHIKNGTFGKGGAPDGIKTIPADWVFKIKHRGGPIDVKDLGEKQFKARVVIRGQHMREGLNFNDTFAPVAKPATLRALLAVAAKYKCMLKSGDVETAFLTAKMDCEVWVRMPPFWGNVDDTRVSDANPPLPAQLLLKGVPGIPQGSRLFYETFAARLSSLGYKPSLADKCLFINHSSKERNAVLIWVDDFIVMHEKEDTFLSFIAQLRTAFNIPLVGPLVSFLGMTIFRDVEKKQLFISQANSITVLLERSKMLDSNPSSTPCASGSTFSKVDSPSAVSDNNTVADYRSLIALANFISCWSRPDITFVVNKLCKFMSNPGDLHWKYLKQLLRYLAGTRSVGINYCFDDPSHGAVAGLHGYTDSSFADCPDSGRSTLAYVFLYHGAVLSWYSKLNGYVTTCTNHSEYSALALGAKEAEWLVLLFSQLDEGRQHTPVPILVDNSGVVSMVYNPVDHQSNKHVKIGCHYTRELSANRVIIPQRVASEENLADVFTKPLNVGPFRALTSHFVTANENILMMRHEDLEVPNDSSDFEPSPDDAVLPDPVGTSQDAFQRSWPFISVMKAYVKAVAYEIKEMPETFTTGRQKYEITFYGSNIGSGTRYVISKHDGMQLRSKKGRPYMVCKLTPREESMLPPVLDTPTTANVTPTRATITPQPPQLTLTCLKCGMAHTLYHAHISCTSCLGGDFSWSCGCTVTQESKIAPVNQTESPVVKEERPKRQAAKKWPIKYEAPPRRGTVYHHLSCTAMKGGRLTQASIDFANAYNMKRADCCANLFV
jgi:hypothetical protein